MYSLKISNSKVDLSNNFSVTLNNKTIDLINPIDRPAAFTYTISLPRTKSNNTLFDYIAEDCVIDKFKTTEFDCELSYALSPIIYGKFFLDNITETTYEGQIISNNLSWVDKISDDYLQSITGYTISFPKNIYSASTINTPAKTINWYNEFGNADTTDVVFPMNTYGNYNYATYDQEKNSLVTTATSYYAYSAGTRLSADDIIPSYFYGNSIKNIFNYFGLNVESSIFDKIKNVIIPYTGSDLFPWNWNELGDIVWYYDPFDITAEKDYFKDFDFTIINYDNGPINPFVSGLTGITEYRGFSYKCRATGTIQVRRFTRANLDDTSIAIFKGDSQSVNKLDEQLGPFIFYDIEVTKGDVLLFMASDGTAIDGLVEIRFGYTNYTEQINIQNILPKVKILDWIKNFLVFYGLYPYFNPKTNTVYLLTLDEFIKTDLSFNLNGLTTKRQSKYTIGNLGLKYTFDKNDGLVVDGEFDYNAINNKDTVIQTIFSGSKSREFICSNLTGNSTTNLISIASIEAIELDRLKLNRIATLDYDIWNSGTTYNIGDKVSIGNRFFVAARSHTNQDPIRNQWWYWIEDFTPALYVTDLTFDYNPRILLFDGNVTSASTGNYVDVLGEKVWIATSSFDDSLTMSSIFNNYYSVYRSLINNRTNIIEGRGYIPRHKFFDYLNRPVRINYNSDSYIIISISNYNPETEFGIIQLIKEIKYIDHQ